MPTSIAPGSGSLTTDGTVVLLQRYSALSPDWMTALNTPDAAERLALSSTARVSICAAPVAAGAQLYVQAPVPWAGCQVLPPSTETSTPATTPPPVALAVPLI